MGRSEELLGYGPIKVVGLPAEGEQPAIVVLMFRSEDEQHTVTIALRADFVRDQYLPNIESAAEGALKGATAPEQPPAPKMTRRCPRCSMEPGEDPGFETCPKRLQDGMEPAEAAEMGCLWGMSQA